MNDCLHQGGTVPTRGEAEMCLSCGAYIQKEIK